MGIYTDLATGSSTIKAAKPRVGLGRASAEALLAQAEKFDPTIASDYAAQDEVQTIPEQTDAGAGDTYTLNIVIPKIAINITTAAIAYDATAATIEAAIDTAATAATWTDWTNADISVAEENSAGLDDGYITLTFDGDSVTERGVEVIVLTATGFTKSGVSARTTGGQTDRKATMALFYLGVVTGTLQDSVEAPSDWTKPAALVKRPRYGLIKDLAHQAAVEDGSDDVITAVNALYDLQ